MTSPWGLTTKTYPTPWISRYWSIMAWMVEASRYRSISTLEPAMLLAMAVPLLWYSSRQVAVDHPRREGRRDHGGDAEEQTRMMRAC